MNNMDDMERLMPRIMVECCKVNRDYRRLPAGKVPGLETMTALYERIAGQSLDCALAWRDNELCPGHEPAVDGFWWGVVAWSDAFGLSMGVDQVEWGRYFVATHEQFANYLRPGRPPEPLPTVDGSPAKIILTLDALWTELVIKLTSQWGFLHHLKDREAMLEAQRLQVDLQNPESPVYKAFLKSDLIFFRHLFKAFPFSTKTKKHINAWLKEAEEAL